LQVSIDSQIIFTYKNLYSAKKFVLGLLSLSIKKSADDKHFEGIPDFCQIHWKFV
jgi:hypothetical protein